MKTLFALLLAALAGASQAADNARFFPLNIEEVGGKALASYAADRAWSSLPQGAVEFEGVPFNIVSKLQVQGNGDAQANRLYPTRIMGIRVGLRPARLHLMHGGNLNDRDGQPVVSLHFRYADGSAYTNHLAYGVHFRDWWKHIEEPLDSITDPGSKQVWAGRSAETDRRGSTHRMFKTTIELPPTEKTLETIDLFSLFSRSSYVVVGMTVEMAAPGAPAGKPLPSADDAKYRDEILLRVTDRAKTPVPGTRIRGVSQATAYQSVALGLIEDGEFEPGAIMVDFPAGTRQLRFTATSPKYASAELIVVPGTDGRLPREAAVTLNAGTRIGGIVRAQNGRPVPRAKVEVSGLKRDAAGKATPFRYAEVTADPQGNWKTGAVPDNFTDLSFKVTHAEFRPKDFKLSDDGANGTVSRVALLDGAAEFTLKSGIAVTGTVRDDEGKAAPDVMLTLTYGGPQRKTTRGMTDAEGGFRFVLLEEGAASLLAEAGGFAPTFRPVDPIDDAPPIQLALTRGRTLKGRVFELKPPQQANRSPASGVDVLVTAYDTPLIRWSGRTDGSGQFEWQNAPLVALRVAAGRNGSETETYVPPKTNDIEIVLRSAILAWGTVVDAETRKPIPEFTVTPGENWNEDQMNWRPQDAVQARDGAFTLTHRDRGRASERTVIKVEAPGYWPQSAFVRDAGASSNAFELRRGSNPKGVAKLPNGQPAARAEVAIAGEGYLALGKGQFSARRGGGRQPGLTRSDAEGRFELPLSLSQRVVIVHPDGYGETTLSNLADRAEVTLEPWGTVEGVVMVGNKPKANEDVKLNENKGSDGVQYDYEAFDMKTDSEGRFRFTHVPPGPRWLVRLIPTNNKSRAWSHQTPVNVVAGKVAQVTVGGTGRAVTGKVVASDPSRDIEWSSGHHSFGTVQPQPPRFSSPDEYRTWAASPEAKAAREGFRYYAVVFAKDGTFRVDDVPAGQYELRLFFNEPRDPARPGNQGKTLGNIRHPVEIGPLPNGRSDEPLDVGTLELKLRE